MSYTGRKLHPRVIRTVPGQPSSASHGTDGFVKTQRVASENGNATCSEDSLLGAEFSVRLHLTLRYRQNLVISPSSARDALALALLGAAGETRNEIIRWVPDPRQHAISSSHQMARDMISSANGVFVDSSYSLSPGFISDVKEFCDAEATSVPFEKDSMGSVGLVNGWVSKHTRGKITRLISTEDIDANTKLILTNAVHFKGRWAWPFKRDNTRPRPFYNLVGPAVEVPMMHASRHFDIARLKQLGATAVRVPYEGESLSMVLLIPEELGGIVGMEERLTGDVLATAEFRSTHIAFGMPRFKIETQESLISSLERLEVKKMFSDQANFSGMSRVEALKVGAVTHSATIEVDEEGTEAAAASGIRMVIRSLPARIEADRPFAFAIQENESKKIWFMGRVSQL